MNNSNFQGQNLSLNASISKIRQINVTLIKISLFLGLIWLTILFLNPLNDYNKKISIGKFITVSSMLGFSISISLVLTTSLIEMLKKEDLKNLNLENKERSQDLK